MLYAKSKPIESIAEHTKLLLEKLTELENIYGEKLSENANVSWNEIKKLLIIAAQYHDAGKVYTPFQNQICEALDISITPTDMPSILKHEQLSPLFLPALELNLTREEEKIVKTAIYFHHERKSKSVLPKDFYVVIDQVIEKDFKPRIKEIASELQLPINQSMKSIQLSFIKNEIQNKKEEKERYLLYCMVKGLLHKLDYTASAHMSIEKKSVVPISVCVEDFMRKNKFKQNELQKFCQAHQKENLVLIGSTGIGKTEAALLWSESSKLFFTLPFRVSINAIYDRILENLNYEKDFLGLLHSTAFDYLEQKEDLKEELEMQQEIYEKSRMLSMNITTCTIDQIFPFAFLYKGYEYIYSVLSYSKIVIDEIQAYSPHIVAVLLKGIEMIHDIGGKFMIMTATLPGIYKEELEARKIPFQFGTYLKKNEKGEEVKRHRVSLLEKSILEDVDLIIERAATKKVLVIVNTIRQAIKIYQECKQKIIDQEKEITCKVLHSRFIQKDRNLKEHEIKEFSEKENETGIWITTQLVEASIDIDFDVLYTEAATLDSLFQRMGRCYRKRELQNENTNVFIYTKEASGISNSKGGIYDVELVEKGISKLKEVNGQILEEEQKIKMVEKLYSKENLKGTKFLDEFENSVRILNNFESNTLDKEKAQKMLREMQSSTVIPEVFYEDIVEEINKYKTEKDFKKKQEIKRNIMQYTTTISKGQFYKLKNANQIIKAIDEIPEICLVACKYNFERGLILEKDIEYDTESRFC